jgi:hypothetical protein
MIIDEILEAKEGRYNARDFYEYVSESEAFFNSEWPISRAMDGGTNKDVQRELCAYIDKNGYNPEIKTFVNGFTWVD